MATKILPKFDPAIEYLIRELQLSIQQQPDLGRLWLADEHLINTALLGSLKGKFIFVSNRFDQFQLAKNYQLNSSFSDFEVEDAVVPDEIYLRVPKERAQIHYLINSAFRLLSKGGSLFLAGFKGEGIRSHLGKAEKLFGNQAKVQKEKNQLWLCKITKQATNNPQLDDQDYRQLREIQIGETVFWSKPGLYGWDKIDRGSKLLADCLLNESQEKENLKILDLGCGYGYLSQRARALKPASLVATDNCAAALIAARKNLTPLNTKIIASDAGNCLEGKFDLILCNPPFHQGFSVNPNLHPKFLKNTKRLLSQNGTAWYVVNQFVALEKFSKEAGLSCQEINRQDGFKILKLTKL